MYSENGGVNPEGMSKLSLPGAEEVVDMRGAGLTQTYGSEVQHCLWIGKVRPKKKRSHPPHQLCIYKLHKNPYIAHYTLL